MPERTVLTVNTGSSSLKAAVFDADDLTDRHLTALVEHIGHESALRVTNRAGDEIANQLITAKNHGEALAALIDWLGCNGEREPLVAIGHRSVSYTHLRAHETVLDLVCRLLLEKKNKNKHRSYT